METESRAQLVNRSPMKLGDKLTRQSDKSHKVEIIPAASDSSASTSTLYPDDGPLVIMNPLLYLLVMGSVFLLVILFARSNNEQQSVGSVEPREDPFIVVLILKPSSTLVSRLKVERRLSPEQVDDLFFDTRSVWSGSYNDYRNSQISGGFTNPDFRDPSGSPVSVYLVRFKLKGAHSGFLSGSSTRARLEAFRDLAGPDSRLEEISDLLQPKAYNDAKVFPNS